MKLRLSLFTGEIDNRFMEWPVTEDGLANEEEVHQILAKAYKSLKAAHALDKNA